MAFNSVKPTVDGDVKDYVSDLDERTKTEFGVQLIDSGHNANQHFIKHPDGTMIQTNRVTCTFTTTQALVGNITFARPFIDSYYINATIAQDLSTVIRGNTNHFVRNKNASGAQLLITANGSSDIFITTTTVVFEVIAVGRWK